MIVPYRNELAWSVLLILECSKSVLNGLGEFHGRPGMIVDGTGVAGLVMEWLGGSWVISDGVDSLK